MPRFAVFTLACCMLLACDADRQIDVYPTPQGDISSTLYSMFIETEINHGGEGGLYAEMIPNRDFETLGRGIIPSVHSKGSRPDTIKDTPGLDPREPPANKTDYRPWWPTDEDVLLSIVNDAPFPQNPHSIEVTTTSPAQGLSNPGYWGLSLRKGLRYTFNFYAKLTTAQTLSVGAQLSCNGIAQTVTWTPLSGAGWARYSGNLTIPQDHGCEDGVLSVLLSEAGTVRLDGVSLFPGDAVAGLFRSDIYALLERFAPPMIRLPGGTYIEGTGLRTRWNWKNTLGTALERPGHYNSIWGYWVTDGFGVYEMLALCKALKAAPLFVLFTGFSFNSSIPYPAAGEYAEEAVKLLEYVNGDHNTHFGSLRAQHGIRDPLGMTTVEIGNEESTTGGLGYQGHYDIIASALLSVQPTLKLVGNSNANIDPTVNRTAQCSPCVGGCGVPPLPCTFFDEHRYGQPEEFPPLATTFAEYDASFCHTQYQEKCPDMYVLEYGAFTGGMKAAAADAFLLMGFEKSPHVKATAYAPVLNNVDSPNWEMNLLNFDAGRIYATPSYYVQLLLKDSLGDTVLGTTHSVEDLSVNVVASVKGNRDVSVKIVNFQNCSEVVTVGFGAFTLIDISPIANAVFGDDAEGLVGNSLDAPELITIQEVAVQVNISNNEAVVSMPPWSVYVLYATVLE